MLTLEKIPAQFFCERGRRVPTSF